MRAGRWVFVFGILLALLALPMTASATWGSFWDDDGSTHEADIEAIAAAGITKGCGDGRFCPKDPVTREQMAAFLHRALKGQVPSGQPETFTDISSSTFTNDIAWLSATGITRGCGDGKFCPRDPVTREQMAAFLRRALEGSIPAGNPIAFSDLSGTRFAADIAWLSATGITKGCGSDRFCPRDPVTREQMASFLTRALGLDPIQPQPNFTDGISVSPGTDIQRLVNSNPPGSTFVLKTGIHRNQRVVPKDGNTFVGEPGTIMDGGNQTSAAFANGGSNVTIQNLIIQNYDVGATQGAIRGPARGWRILDNEIRHNRGGGINVGWQAFSSVTIEGNYVHRNEQIGIVLQDTVNARVVDNRIAYNNPNDTYAYGWEAGGTKFLRTTNLYVARNRVHNNHGPGLWTDTNNYNTVYEKNTVWDNYGPGIFHEVSYDAVIRDNTVTGNAHNFYVGGILVASSSNVEVHGNTLSGNDGGIMAIQDDRGSGNRGTFQITGLNVHNNDVTWNQAQTGVHRNSGPNVTATGTISFSSNTYKYTGGFGQPFRWGSSNLTWQQWRNLGHDTNGSFD